MVQTKIMMKNYTELSKLKTFEERYEYLRQAQLVGAETFGSERYLNQHLYNTYEWKRVRRQVMLRDSDGDYIYDLGVKDRPIFGKVIIHHINPLTADDVINRNPCVFDLENLISVSPLTHNAIHYSNSDILQKKHTPRTPNDTCPWKKGA